MIGHFRYTKERSFISAIRCAYAPGGSDIQERNPYKETVIPLHQGKLFVGNVSADLSEEDSYPK